MAIDPNLLAILTSQGGLNSGNPGMLPRFSGGQGMDQNLLALLVSQGMLPKRYAGDGSLMLPNMTGPTYGFHSPSALDAFKAEGSMASRMGPYVGESPFPGRVPTQDSDFTMMSDQLAQDNLHQAMMPKPQELASMQGLRNDYETQKKKKLAGMYPSFKMPKLF